MEMEQRRSPKGRDAEAESVKAPLPLNCSHARSCRPHGTGEPSDRQPTSASIVRTASDRFMPHSTRRPYCDPPNRRGTGPVSRPLAPLRPPWRFARARAIARHMNSILDRIKAYKLEEVAARKAARPMAEIEAAARLGPEPRGFLSSLRRAEAKGGYALIAEIKKASPSKGLIRADFDPPSLASAYRDGGAACLSVLTDGPSFQGDDGYLTAAHAASGLPVLRKDFLYDPYQVAEARALGADCVLIIMASVDDGQALELEHAARDWGMDALIEVHDRAELDRALTLRSPLIGVNNRNLKTFAVDLSTTEALAPHLPTDRHLVAESGLFAPRDLARLAAAGARSFLIGESLMRQQNVAAATRAILADPVPRAGAA